MFKSIGTVIVLVTIVNLFSSAAASFENAVVATFDSIAAAAIVSEELLKTH